MDRETAAAVLGVRADARLDRLAKAPPRARVKATHPDRFPPGSEAWEDANHELQRVNEALWVLTGPPSGRGAATGRRGRAARGTGVRRGAVMGAQLGGLPQPRRDSDRLARAWGYGWGGFLMLSAIACALVGATQDVNNALPIWSPGLALTRSHRPHDRHQSRPPAAAGRLAISCTHGGRECRPP